MNIEVIETGEHDGNSKYVPLTDSEVKQLATDYYKDQIFASWDIPKNQQDMIFSIFMVMLFMDDITRKQVLANNSDGMHLFEYMDKAGPRSVNGYPIFMSCRIISTCDAKRIVEKRNEIAALLDAI